MCKKNYVYMLCLKNYKKPLYVIQFIEILSGKYLWTEVFLKQLVNYDILTNWNNINMINIIKNKISK